MKHKWTLIIALLAAMSSSSRGATTTTTQSAEALPAPTLVTLKLDNTPAIDALKQLLTQADIPTDWFANDQLAERLGGVTASGTFEKEPFNKVLLELCRQCKLEPTPTQAQGQPMAFAIRRPDEPRPAATRSSTGPATTQSSYGRVMVSRPPPRGRPMPPGAGLLSAWVDAPAMHAGPLTFIASEARRTSRIELDGGTDPSAQTLELSVRVLRDPKVPAFSMSGLLDVDEATDESGRSLKAPPNPNRGAMRPRILTDGRWSPWIINVPLRYTEESRTLKVLRGRFVTTIITRTEPVEIVNADGAIAGEKKVGDIRFSVGKLAAMGPSGSRLDIVVFRDSDGDQQRFEEVRGIVRNDLFRVNDANDNAGYRIIPQMHAFINNSECRGMIQFQSAQGRGKPAKPLSKVVWNVPVEFQEFSIPVEFKDLSLP